MNDLQEWGARGEALAWNFLMKHGYSILEKNYRTRFGEVDVIAEKRGTLVFLEIKTRRNESFGLPAEAVDWRKRQRLSRSAEAFLQAKRWENRTARFDILSILWDGLREPQFSLIEDAFALGE